MLWIGCTLCMLIAVGFAVWVWCFRLGIQVDDDLIIPHGGSSWINSTNTTNRV